MSILASGLSLSAQNNFDIKAGFPADPNLRTGTLSNGIKYYIRKNSKPENRMELRLAVNAGSNQENDDQQGLAHFCEHMAFNGSKNFKKNDLVNFLEGVGTKFGAHLNAYTSFDETVYMLQIPTDNKETMSKSFTVLEDWAQGLSFDPTEVDKERGVVIEEWRLGQGADERMRDKWWPILFGGSRYGDRLPIGKKEILEKFKHETLIQFYRDWYRPDLMAVIAVGDFNPDEVEQEIKTRFSKIPAAKSSKKRDTYMIPSFKEPRFAVASDKEAAYTLVQMYYMRHSAQNTTIGDYRRNLTHALFNAMMQSRISEVQKKSDSPFLFGMSAYQNFIRNHDAYASIAVVSENGIEKGLRALIAENERVKRFGFTQTELDRKKKEVLKQMEKSYNERSKNESANYAGEYVRNFLSNEPIPGIEFEYELYKKFIPEITLDEINKLAAGWITNGEGLAIIVTAPEKEGVKLPTTDELKKIWTDATKDNVTAYVDNAPDKPLIEEEPTGGKVFLTKDMADIGAVEWTMRNGAKVIVKSTDFKNDEILISAFSMGGTSLYDIKDLPSAEAAADLVNNSGLGAFSSTQLEKVLTGKICNVSPSISTISEGFNGSSSVADVETALQMIYLYFTAPRIDDEGYNTFMEQKKTMLQTQGSVPESVFMDTVRYVMSGRSPRRQPETLAGLKDINRDRALAIYKERFSDASQFTFVFVGKIDMEKFKPMVEKYIGGLPAPKVKETYADEGIRYPQGKNEKLIKKGTAPKAMVNIMYTGDFNWTPENRLKARALSMLANIKLRENLREDKGGVYGVGCGVRPEHYPVSRFQTYIGFGCDPNRADELIKASFEVIDGIRKNGCEAVNLQKVKETLKREFESDSKENDYWLSLIQNNYMNGEKFEGYKNFNAMVDALQSDDFKALASLYFNDASRNVFKMVPEK
jgi:zinc protease